MECKNLAFGTTVSCVCVCVCVCLSLLGNGRTLFYFKKCWMFLSFLEAIKMWITEFKILARLRALINNDKTLHWNLPNYTGLRMWKRPPYASCGRRAGGSSWHIIRTRTTTGEWLSWCYDLITILNGKSIWFFFFFEQKDLYFIICFDQNV